MAKIVFNEALISLGAEMIQRSVPQQTLDEAQATNDFLRAEVFIRQGINDFNFSMAQALHQEIQMKYSQIISEVSTHCVALERILSINSDSSQSLYDDLWDKLVFDQKCIVIDRLKKEGKIKSLSEVIAIQY